MLAPLEVRMSSTHNAAAPALRLKIIQVDVDVNGGTYPLIA